MLGTAWIPGAVKGEDADVKTTAIHFRDAAAAEIEDFVSSFRREVFDRVTCVEIFGKDKVLFEGNLADRWHCVGISAVHSTLGARQGLSGICVPDQPCTHQSR